MTWVTVHVTRNEPTVGDWNHEENQLWHVRHETSKANPHRQKQHKDGLIHTWSVRSNVQP